MHHFAVFRIGFWFQSMLCFTYSALANIDNSTPKKRGRPTNASKKVKSSNISKTLVKRGRPKKNRDDTERTVKVSIKPKKRGRPKKMADVTNVETNIVFTAIRENENVTKILRLSNNKLNVFLFFRLQMSDIITIQMNSQMCAQLPLNVDDQKKMQTRQRR